MKRLRPIVATSAVLAALLAWPTSAQTPGPFSPTGSTPPNTLFFNQLNSALGAKQDFPGLTFNTTRNGLVPQSPGGTGSFLRADGAWVPPLTTTINSTPISGGVTGRPVFDNGGVFGEYTAAQLTAYLNVFSASTQGLVPPSGGLFAGFLRADGIWIAPPLSSAIVLGQTPISGGTSGRVVFDNAGAFGEYTNAQLTSLVGLVTATTSGAIPAFPNNTTTFFRGDGTYSTPANFTSGAAGYVPASGGGTTNFLRADGTFAAPPSGSLTVGTTAISGGTSGRVVYDNAGVIGERAVTGTGTNVATSTGTLTSGDCVKIDANGNLIDAGGPCGSTNLQTFSASGTWTKPANITWVEVFECGAGGGGGGGAQTASGTSATGGGGGGAGMCLRQTYRASDISGNGTVTIGAAGTAGVGATTTATAGGNGGNGGDTSFAATGLDATLIARGGAGGQGGQINAASSGGASGGYLVAGTGQASAGIGSVAGGTASFGTDNPNYLGGSSGGGAINGLGSANGGNAAYGATGGGAGGTVTAAPTPLNGSSAGSSIISLCSNSGTVGNNGNSTTTAAVVHAGCGGGGGGGQVGNTGAPGNGGAGFQGGGGGGGGTVCSSGGTCTARNGGTGGAGGAGFTWVLSW